VEFKSRGGGTPAYVDLKNGIGELDRLGPHNLPEKELLLEIRIPYSSYDLFLPRSQNTHRYTSAFSKQTILKRLYELE
jgi:hypothetical protein